MSLLVDLYSSRSLTEAVNISPVPEPFVLDKVFKVREPHETDMIDFEVIKGSAEIAEYVHNDQLEPTLVGKGKVSVGSFKLPRTFERKLFSAQELNKISQIGNIYGTADARKAAQMEYIQRELDALKNRAIRTREKAACEAISTGKILIAQDNIAQDYDFGFASGVQLLTPAAAKLWTASTSNPMNDIREWRRLISQRSGVTAKYLILGVAAAAAFIANEKVKKELDTNNNVAGRLDLTIDPTGAAVSLGRFGGVEVFEYSQQYVNSSGTSVDMIASDKAVMLGDSNNFRLHYGAVYRMQKGISVPMIADYYIDTKQDDLGVMWNLEQKSLPTIHDAGLVISAKVV